MSMQFSRARTRAHIRSRARTRALNHFPRRTALALLLIALIACGKSLIRDPSFELWCGDELCAPWESEGRVTRVGTWHEHDYAVSLGDGASVSQLSREDAVECIEFAVIADVDAAAQVQLEMDFLDDGEIESQQAIPESHWSRLTFLVKAPTWYDSVRFILRKEGSGRAVLAQIQATSSDDCEGDPIKLMHRPSGGECDQAAECTSALCSQAPNRFTFSLEENVEPKVCSACDHTGHPCADDEICSVQVEDGRHFYGCVAAASSELGAWCEEDEECASGRCEQTLPLSNATCGECSSDTDCEDGETCGTQLLDEGRAARVCITPEPEDRGELGALCGADAQCESGICCSGLCAECCFGEDQACAGGAICGHAETQWLIAEPALCDPGSGDRERGEACTSDLDCESGDCRNPEVDCILGAETDGASHAECGVLRVFAGTCL